MIDVSKYKFVSDFITTFLATWAAEQYNLRGASARDTSPPVQQAMHMAQVAWCELLAHGMIRG